MQTNEQAGNTEPAVLTVREAQKILRLSHGAVYAAIAAGEIPHIRIGRRILIPSRLLQAKLEAASVGK